MSLKILFEDGLIISTSLQSITAKANLRASEAGSAEQELVQNAEQWQPWL